MPRSAVSFGLTPIRLSPFHRTSPDCGLYTWLTTLNSDVLPRRWADDGEELAVIDMEGNPIDLDSLERQVHVRHLQEVVVPLRPGSLRPTLEQPLICGDASP